MRILFFERHPMWIHGLPNGFKEAGHEVLVSATLSEENVKACFDTFLPDLVVSMGWTDEHTRQNLSWIRKYVKDRSVPYVYWATEDPSFTHVFSLPLIQLARPDFVFTICRERVPYYERLGLKSAHLPYAYHKSANHPTASDEAYQAQIAIVANAYPDYITAHPDCVRNLSLQALVNPLLQENIRIDFWGKNWNRMSPFTGRSIPEEWQHGYLHYTEANKVYNSAQIVIGLQNSQLTQRTYEILGSGGFLLTYNTPPVRELFQPGQDLVVSHSPEQTLGLVRHYLEHAEERELIRKQGILAVSTHTYKHRAEYMLHTLGAYNMINIQAIER